jgi:hypothetical protein
MKMNPLIYPMTYQLDPNIISNKIIKKSIRGYYSDYFIFNYDKLGMCFNDEKTGMYRSVVFSNPDKRLLAFSPVMSISSAVFMNKYPVIDYDVYIQEFVEGIMINLFYDYRVDKWVIATKGGIGGKYGYGNVSNVSNKTLNKHDTFYEMFLDALHANKDESLNHLEFLDYFPKCLSYTFILQHPKNIISVPVSKPRVVLVSAYLINKEKNTAEFIPMPYYERWPEFKNLAGIIEFPKDYVFHEYKEMFSDLYSENKSTGYIITNIRTGERCRIKSYTHDILKRMTRIDSTIHYQYFCIRHLGKLKEYMKMFPQHKKAFYLIEEEYENMIKRIHDLYCDVYIYKTIYPDTLDIKDYTHIYKLHHNVYLPSINNKGSGGLRKVYKKTVRKYFDSMEPRELLHITSQDKR